MAALQEHIETIERYVKHGCEPGSCTRAILENDLEMAIANSDPITRYLLADIIVYLVNHVDRECWGNPGRVRAWLARDWNR